MEHPFDAPRFVKRPVTVEAMQWDGTAAGATPIINWVLANDGTARYHDGAPHMHSVACRCDGRGIVPGPAGHAVPCPATEPTGAERPHIAVTTLDATGRVFAADWVIRGAHGEFYPCAGDVFIDTYEPPHAASVGADAITAERRRQIHVEGWTADHDDEHDDHEMLHAAMGYIEAAYSTPGALAGRPPKDWPWHPDWWKPSEEPRRNLVKAGALIAAEIDRLDRAEESGRG